MMFAEIIVLKIEKNEFVETRIARTGGLVGLVAIEPKIIQRIMSLFCAGCFSSFLVYRNG